MIKLTTASLTWDVRFTMVCVTYRTYYASHVSHASQQASHASQHKITLFLT